MRWNEMENMTVVIKQLLNYFYSLGITLETFRFPEIVQVFSNPTLITQSSINPQQNEDQPLFA